MDSPTRSDQVIAWLTAGVTAVIGVGTLLRRWKHDASRQQSTSEGVYISGTKTAFDVLQQQINNLQAEVNLLRSSAGVFRDKELEYVSQIRKLEAQNQGQAEEIKELKDELADAKERLARLEQQKNMRPKV